MERIDELYLVASGTGYYAEHCLGDLKEVTTSISEAMVKVTEIMDGRIAGIDWISITQVSHKGFVHLHSWWWDSVAGWKPT